MPRHDETRPAATGRSPNGFSFDGEYSKDSADAHRDQRGRHYLNDLGLDHGGLLHPPVLGRAP
jgi:hypothetical protein